MITPHKSRTHSPTNLDQKFVEAMLEPGTIFATNYPVSRGGYQLEPQFVFDGFENIFPSKISSLALNLP